MRTGISVVASLALIIVFVRPVIAEGAGELASTASEQKSADHNPELHFETVLTVHCQVASVDPASRLLTVKGSNGAKIRLEVRDAKKLEGIRAGDRLLVRYIEAVRIRKGTPDRAMPAVSLKAGVLEAQPDHQGGGVSRELTLVATVEAVDELDQEITLRGPDGSLETVMVEDPEYLKSLKTGDRIVFTHLQALALSVERES
jgi:hypothetical protein